MEGHSSAINALAVSPDGRFLYTGSDDSTVKQWETSTGTVRELAMHAAVLYTCAVRAHLGPIAHASAAVSESTQTVGADARGPLELGSCGGRISGRPLCVLRQLGQDRETMGDLQLHGA